MTTRRDARTAGMYACVRLAPGRRGPAGSTAAADGELMQLACEFSPRVESHGPGIVALDIEGLTRLYGNARAIGQALHRAAAERRLKAHVAIAATRTTAILVALARPGVTVVPWGAEATTLASLPLETLERFHAAGVDSVPGADRRRACRQRPGSRHYRLAPSPESHREEPRGTDHSSASAPRATGESTDRPAAREACRTIRRWGLETLGQLAALPPAELFERVGIVGPALQRLARGGDPRPLVPDARAPRFMNRLELEWPLEGREPLAFALGRVLEPLCRRLERHDRGCAVLQVTLCLVTREAHVRRLELPTPIRDSRVLRTLILLDLESHPPPAGIDAIEIEVEPAPGPLLQFSLLTRARPVPEQLSTLLARLQALVGEGRCGMPVVPETHRPGSLAVGPFSGEARGREMSIAPPARAASSAEPTVGRAVLRRVRVPMPIRVQTQCGRPVAVWLGRVGGGGAVVTHAGPWRTSGGWWCDPEAPGGLAAWNRDEWDVGLTDGGVYRIHRDRDTHRWFLEGLVD